MTANIDIHPDRHGRRLLELLIIAVGFGTLTQILNTHWVIDFMVFCIFVLSFDLLYGYMGHLSFGVMLYYGTGAYATALWLALGNQNALLAIGVGVGVTLAAAVLLGAIAIRTSGAAFALINMAFNKIGFFMVRTILKDYTNGDDGIAVTAQPLFGFIDFYNETSVYLLMLGVVLTVYWLLKTLMDSPYGTLVKAIHENEDRVKFFGYSTLKFKWLTFVISSTIAGLAGSLFTCVRGFVSPELISPFGNVDVVFAVLIGGAGYLYGAMIGGLVFMLIKNYLPIWVGKANNLLPFSMPQWELWLGVLLLFIVFAWREGIMGLVHEKISVWRVRVSQGDRP